METINCIRTSQIWAVLFPGEPPGRTKNLGQALIRLGVKPGNQSPEGVRAYYMWDRDDLLRHQSTLRTKLLRRYPSLFQPPPAPAAPVAPPPPPRQTVLPLRIPTGITRLRPATRTEALERLRQAALQLAEACQDVIALTGAGFDAWIREKVDAAPAADQGDG